MIWKEIFAEPGMTFGAFGKVIVAVIVVVSFAPPLWEGGFIAWELLGNGSVNWRRIPEDVNLWVRVVGTTVASLTLLGVAVRAAGSISGERDRQTLDNLLTSPLELRAILFAKWLGSILSVRWAWIWLSVVWGLGVTLGGLDLVTLPWLLLIWSVYAAFFACLGQRFSITSSTTLRATLMTLAVLTLLTFSHWLPRLFLEPGRSYYASDYDLFSWLISVQAFGLTPPMALGWFAFRGDDIRSTPFATGMWNGPSPLIVLAAIAAGLVLWGVAATCVWHLNNASFAWLTGRSKLRHPSPLREPYAAPAFQPERQPAEARQDLLFGEQTSV